MSYTYVVKNRIGFLEKIISLQTEKKEMPVAKGRGSNINTPLPPTYSYTRTDSGAPSHNFGATARGTNGMHKHNMGNWVDVAAPGRGLYYGGQMESKIRTAASQEHGFGYMQAAHQQMEGVKLDRPERFIPNFNQVSKVDVTKALTRPGINTTGKHVINLIQIDDIMGKRTRLAPESLSSSRV